MDNSQIPSFEIPKKTENAPSAQASVEIDPSIAIDGTHEILPAPVAQPVSTNQVPPKLPSPLATVAPPVAQQAVVQSDDSHIVADDVDVIEKEWVERAKKIITLTSDDPYVETKEINKLKASYLKKRFNKDLPLAKDEAS